ncbi:unnamed protein product, partial [Ectocarpus sp. 12 AP-2014]
MKGFFVEGGRVVVAVFLLFHEHCNRFVLGWFEPPPVARRKRWRLFRQADGKYLLGDDRVLTPTFSPSARRDQVGTLGGDRKPAFSRNLRCLGCLGWGVQATTWYSPTCKPAPFAKLKRCRRTTCF